MYRIYYIRNILSIVELNYTVTEKEFIVVVYIINKFNHYIIGYSMFVHTDHFFIKYSINKLVINGRIIHWLLLLQEFDVTILNNIGWENVVAYFLSRLPRNLEDDP